MQDEGPAASSILKVARDKQSDLIIMGGYGRRPVAEVTLGSVVEEILQTRQHPTLICQ